MELNHFCPPADARFTIGATDQKMHSLHEEFSRKRTSSRGHRLFNKTCSLKFVRAARETLQRSVASRSSALRQGKLAELRAGMDSNEFDAVQAAARKASSSPVTTRIVKPIKAGKRHKKFNVSTSLQHGTPYFTDVAGNMNTLVANDNNIFKFTASFSKQNSGNEDTSSAG